MLADSRPPKRIWDERGDKYIVLRIVALPQGYCGPSRCLQCPSYNLVGAIIGYEDGSPVIDSSDEDDPSLLCLDCGFWRD